MPVRIAGLCASRLQSTLSLSRILLPIVCSSNSGLLSSRRKPPAPESSSSRAALYLARKDLSEFQLRWRMRLDSAARVYPPDAFHTSRLTYAGSSKLVSDLPL